MQQPRCQHFRPNRLSVPLTIKPLNQNSSDNLSFDLIVIGSGPAGLAIAHEFLSTNVRVAVLESGGQQRNEADDALNSIESVGQQRAPQNEVGCRVFGGASSLWTGRCGELDPIDFHARPWLPESGWPIDPAKLKTYYQRAGHFLGVPPVVATDMAVRDLYQPFDAPPFDGGLFKPVLWQFSSDSGGTTEVREFTPEGEMPSQLLQHTGAPKPMNVGEKYHAMWRGAKSTTFARFPISKPARSRQRSRHGRALPHRSPFLRGNHVSWDRRCQDPKTSRNTVELHLRSKAHLQSGYTAVGGRPTRAGTAECVGAPCRLRIDQRPAIHTGKRRPKLEKQTILRCRAQHPERGHSPGGTGIQHIRSLRCQTAVVEPDRSKCGRMCC